jgi:hypothetical protein
MKRIQEENKIRNNTLLTFLPRSIVMKATTAFRLLGTIIALVLITGIAVSQDLKLNGNITNDGTIKVGRDVINQATAAVAVSGTGVVQLKGSGAGSHSIKSASGSYAISFSNLDLIDSRPTTCEVDVTATNNLRIGDGSTAYTAAGNGFDIGAQTMTLGNLSSYMATSTAALTFSGGAVVYDGAAAQTVLSKTGGVVYGNLTTSGADKTAGDDITVNSGSTFTNSVNVDFGAHAFTGTGVTFANTGTLISGGSVTLGTGTSVNGTFRYNQTGASQTVASATYTNLDLAGTSTKTIGDVSIADVYAVAGGARSYTAGTTVTFSKAGDQTIPGESGYKNITLSGSGVKTLSGGTTIAGALDASVAAVNVTVDAGTTTLGSSSNFGGNLTVTGTLDGTASGSTTTFSGAGQSISGAGSITGFYNLTLSGTAAKSSGLDLVVSNTFTPSSGIDMGTHTLDITNNAAGAVGAFGSNAEVKGAMKRAVTTTGTYTFNNDATTVAFATAAPTDLTLTVQPATNPTGYDAATHVNRNVAVAYTGAWAAGIATLKLGYADAEKPTADEDKLKFFEGSASNANKIATGNAPSRVAAGAGSFGTIELVGIRPTGASGGIAAAQVSSGSEIVMSNIATAFVTVADGQNFSSGATWDEGVAPALADDAQISHTGIIVDAAAQVNSLAVDATKSVTVSGGNLTAGSVTNDGSITVSLGRALNVSGAFSNSSTGSLMVTGTANLLTGSVLTLASDGNITVDGANGILNIGLSGTASNLTMAGTSTLTLNSATSRLNVFGSLEMGTNSTLVNSGIITIGE